MVNAKPPLQGTIRVIQHRRGAPALRLGLGPSWLPVGALLQLQQLFDQHSFWAQGRDLADLSRMLKRSDVVVSAWKGPELVGFGRASSDGVFRAVLWDVVVASSEKGQGLGRELVKTLLSSSQLETCERVYLMTSQSKGFYVRLGFKEVDTQQLLILNQSG